MEGWQQSEQHRSAWRTAERACAREGGRLMDGADSCRDPVARAASRADGWDSKSGQGPVEGLGWVHDGRARAREEYRCARQLHPLRGGGSAQSTLIFSTGARSQRLLRPTVIGRPWPCSLPGRARDDEPVPYIHAVAIPPRVPPPSSSHTHPHHCHPPPPSPEPRHTTSHLTVFLAVAALTTHRVLCRARAPPPPPPAPPPQPHWTPAAV